MMDDRYDSGICIHLMEDRDVCKCLIPDKSKTKWPDRYCCCDYYESFWKKEEEEK